MTTKDRHPLAVTRIKIATSEQTFCKVGFPFKSIEKFCPNRQGFDGVENDHITFRIPLPQPQDGTEITFDRLSEAVDKWTETFEIKPPKRTQEEMKQIRAQRKAEKAAADASINSYLGVLSHSASYNIRHHLFEEIDGDIIKAA